jgi:hypothetical protein
MQAIVGVLLAAGIQSAGAGAGPAGPTTWVPFAADILITMPRRSQVWGRHVQDEHGCVRSETVHPDGSSMIVITNFQVARAYRLFRGIWTVQPMKLGPDGDRRPPPQLAVGQQVDSIEGFAAYVHETVVRSPRGDYKDRAVVLPALNYFRAVSTLPGGETRKAINIRLSAPPHSEFLPPEGAAVREESGYSGFMSLSAVVLRIAFPGLKETEALTTEETAFPLRTPSGLMLTLVTSVIDETKGTVRIRVLDNATGPTGNVRGDVIDEVDVNLGEQASTTKLGEGFTVRVVRIRARTVPR